MVLAMIEKNDIIGYFKDLRFIKNRDLQEQVVSAWKLAVDRGKWERL